MGQFGCESDQRDDQLRAGLHLSLDPGLAGWEEYLNDENKNILDKRGSFYSECWSDFVVPYEELRLVSRMFFMRN